MSEPAGAPDLTPAAEEERPATTLEVLGSRAFLPFFAGNAISSIGTWFQNLAAAILVYRLTGSTFWVGVVNFAQLIGSLLLAPWSGAAADRFDRRRLLIRAQLVSTVVTAVLAGLTAAGRVTAPIVIGAMAVLGFSLAFMVPALMALVPLLVPRRDLDAALSLNSLTFNLARAVGPVLASVVIAAWGLAPAFAINAASFLVLIAALAVLRPRPQVRSDTRPRFRDSLRSARRHPTVGRLLLLVTAIAATTDPVNTLTPGFATQVLGRADTVTGYLVGAFGAGAVVAAVTLLGWLRRRRHALAVAMAVEGAGMLVFAAAPNLAVAFLGMAIAGAGFISAITRATTRIQLAVSDAELGRVMALWSVAFVGLRPFAALLDGFVADTAGLRAAAVVLALPALVGAVWAARLREPAAAAAS